MKLTMTCPECEAIFDEGLVTEVGEDKEGSIDLCEFEGQDYTCQTCGYKMTLKCLRTWDENGLHYDV